MKSEMSEAKKDKGTAQPMDLNSDAINKLFQMLPISMNPSAAISEAVFSAVRNTKEYEMLSKKLSEVMEDFQESGAFKGMTETMQKVLQNPIVSTKTMDLQATVRDVAEKELLREAMYMLSRPGDVKGDQEAIIHQIEEVGDYINILKPYMEEVYDEDPGSWKGRSTSELMMAADARAREKGEKLPPLGGESPIHAEHLLSKQIGTFVLPNNKIAQVITKGIVDAGEVELLTSSPKTKKTIRDICLLTYEGDVTLSGKPFTEYDRSVYNAVASIYVYGSEDHIVTPAMVYRAMTGMTDSENLSPQQIEAVRRSLDKMRFIRARVDCSATLRAWGATLDSEQIVHGKFDTYLLNADLLEVEAGGKIIQAYQINKPPVLYEYANLVHQVLEVPIDLLTIRNIDSKGHLTSVLPNTDMRIQMKGYLLRRIEGMKGNKKEKNSLTSNVIVLEDYLWDGKKHEGLYTIIGKPTPTRTEAARIRTDVERILNYWKKVDYIKEFQIKKKGNKISGYSIEV